MTRDMGYNSAEIIANKHEYVTWYKEIVDGGLIYSVDFA